MSGTPNGQGLRKDLGLADVYAISTGAMFSSGFFLLPGIAAAQAGPAVILAYLLAGILIIPAMLSKAELCTAMPRAGGTYYFLDRSLGPMVGTVGGLGTWIALVFKSAFALLGVGAYLAVFVEVPVVRVALGLTAVFVILNVAGAKETTRAQRLMVWTLVGILTGFLVLGGWGLTDVGTEGVKEQLTPFFAFGAEGLISTVGLVFVSYAGLTKVASVAEEVRDPDRNIPLGMILSLATATTFYVLGVFLMVTLLDPDQLRSDLAPVATTAGELLSGTPGTIAVVLTVIAALAAFASTGNAGVMSASRYLLAMARDKHIWSGFGRLGRFRTPTPALIATGLTMALALVTLDVQGVAKLASAFQLLIFSLVNLSVVVMRESGIEAYDPGFKSPLYPWMQIAGILVPLWLISQMGWLAIFFTMGITVVGIAWYHLYARDRLSREGALYHVFERLGRNRYAGLDLELRQILKEKGVRQDDPFAEVVAGAPVRDLMGPHSFDVVARGAAELLAADLGIDADTVFQAFVEETRRGATPVAEHAMLPHFRSDEVSAPRLVIVRARDGVSVPEAGEDVTVHAIFFLVSPWDKPGQHLRILAQIAARLDEDGFTGRWLEAEGDAAVRSTLLEDRSILTITLLPDEPSSELIDARVRDAGLPPGVLIAVVRRGEDVIFPDGNTVFEVGDRISFLGEEEGLDAVRARLGSR
ncbi:MAG: amino acid permease [Gemmatimonadetes bacterium]|nr:amino acid permease [Gemmatimonadota bacterium]